MTTDTDPRELPPLPTCRSRFDHAIGTPLFSADQMRAYALAALVAKVPSAPVEAVPQKHMTKENGDCPHWCEACRVEALQRTTTPPQAEPTPSMSKSWQTAVAVAREAPSGRTVVDSAVILAIDKRLTEAFDASSGKTENAITITHVGNTRIEDLPRGLWAPDMFPTGKTENEIDRLQTEVAKLNADITAYRDAVDELRAELQEVREDAGLNLSPVAIIFTPQFGGEVRRVRLDLDVANGAADISMIDAKVGDAITIPISSFGAAPEAPKS